MKQLRWLMAGACACALTACSTPQQPAKDVGKADLAVRSAEQEPRTAETSGADLRMAQDKLERAKIALHDREYDKAQRLAEEATLDAELARVRAESADAEQSASALEAAIQSLQNEAQRGGRMP
jgi:uncharacterized protein DUF4398